MILYELQGFRYTRRGRRRKKPDFTMLFSDHHSAAIALWKAQSATSEYLIQMLDRAAGQGGLAPVVTYDDLVRRYHREKDVSRG